MLEALEPYLPAGDIPKTATFWRETLGFDVTGQSDSWLRVARDQVAVMFGKGDVAAPFGGVFVVRTSQVDEIAARAQAAPEWGPRRTPDNRYEVAFRDPNGYVVNFTQNLNSAEGST